MENEKEIQAGKVDAYSGKLFKIMFGTPDGSSQFLSWSRENEVFAEITTYSSKEQRIAFYAGRNASLVADWLAENGYEFQHYE